MRFYDLNEYLRGIFTVCSQVSDFSFQNERGTGPPRNPPTMRKTPLSRAHTSTPGALSRLLSSTHHHNHLSLPQSSITIFCFFMHIRTLRVTFIIFAIMINYDWGWWLNDSYESQENDHVTFVVNFYIHSDGSARFETQKGNGLIPINKVVSLWQKVFFLLNREAANFSISLTQKMVSTLNECDFESDEWNKLVDPIAEFLSSKITP